MLCRCLHEDPSQEDGPSKGLFEIRGTALQKSLGTDAGADASPSGTTEKSFKAYKACSTSVPNVASWLCLCICVKPQDIQAHIYFISPGTHLFQGWVGSFFIFIFFLSSFEHKLSFTLIHCLAFSASWPDSSALPPCNFELLKGRFSNHLKFIAWSRGAESHFAPTRNVAWKLCCSTSVFASINRILSVRLGQKPLGKVCRPCFALFFCLSRLIQLWAATPLLNYFFWF